MQRPESPSTNLSLGEEQESQEKDWVHLSLELHPEDTIVITSSASEGTVGDTTVPQGGDDVDPDRGETLRDQGLSSVMCGGGVGDTAALPWVLC